MNRQRYKRYLLKKSLITELGRKIVDIVCDIVGCHKPEIYSTKWAIIECVEERGELIPLDIKENDNE